MSDPTRIWIRDLPPSGDGHTWHLVRHATGGMSWLRDDDPGLPGERTPGQMTTPGTGTGGVLRPSPRIEPAPPVHPGLVREVLATLGRPVSLPESPAPPAP